MDKEIPDWARNCPTGKIKFASAADAVKSVRQTRGGGRRKLASKFKGTPHAYVCNACGFHHLSSTYR